MRSRYQPEHSTELPTADGLFCGADSGEGAVNAGAFVAMARIGEKLTDTPGDTRRGLVQRTPGDGNPTHNTAQLDPSSRPRADSHR